MTDLKGEWYPWDPEKAREQVFNTLPGGATSLRLYVGNSATNLRLIEEWEERNYCAYCDEVMRLAWGEDCPICLKEMERTLVCTRT